MNYFRIFLLFRLTVTRESHENRGRLVQKETQHRLKSAIYRGDCFFTLILYFRVLFGDSCRGNGFKGCLQRLLLQLPELDEKASARPFYVDSKTNDADLQVSMIDCSLKTAPSCTAEKLAGNQICSQKSDTKTPYFPLVFDGILLVRANGNPLSEKL